MIDSPYHIYSINHKISTKNSSMDFILYCFCASFYSLDFKCIFINNFLCVSECIHAREILLALFRTKWQWFEKSDRKIGNKNRKFQSWQNNWSLRSFSPKWKCAFTIIYVVTYNRVCIYKEQHRITVNDHNTDFREWRNEKNRQQHQNTHTRLLCCQTRGKVKLERVQSIS